MRNVSDLSPACVWEDIYERVIADPRYLKNIEYGSPRPGHAEGSVKAHIRDLDTNLGILRVAHNFSLEYFWKLEVLIHVHDTFKADAKRDSAILDPQSHASLAKQFLSEFTDDQDMLNIVQYHDLGFATYRKLKTTGKFDEAKIRQGLDAIQDLDLFLWFVIIDTCTPSKGREGVTWFIAKVNELYPYMTVTVNDILPGERVLEGQVW
jgi:hypothetical protein